MARALLCLAASSLCLLAGCFVASPNAGGAQASNGRNSPAVAAGQRPVDPAAIALPAGYHIEPVCTGLTYPTGMTFDDQGRLYVTESGYAYGEDFTTPRLLRVDRSQTTEIARGDVRDGMSNGPWNGVVFANNLLYICEGGVRDGGRIIGVSPKGGQLTEFIKGLPTMGDHQLNGPVVADGYLYFATGTATNSGVVGTDNADFGWLKRHRDFHDIPAKDITLTGQNFTTDNLLSPGSKEKVTTGAYVPFGTPTTAGQVIKGQVPCTGGIMRVSFAAAGGSPNIEVVAWGLRNPFGLAAGPDGRIFVTENSYDVRGSRPVWGTGDLLWALDPKTPGTWYGWPDYFAGERLEDNPGHYKAPGKDAPKTLIANPPNTPPKPVAWFGVHSSACGLDFDRSGKFGHRGDAFVAQFGDMTPGVGKLLAPVGFKVVHVDVTNGVVYDFAVNRGKENGPASALKHGGLERPIACRFSPNGDALYVLDFGVLTEDAKGKPHPVRNTGVLWKITRDATTATGG